jgi:riboflavin kinase/FMN adenylyltransferase
VSAASIVRLESPEPRGWRSPAVAVGNFDGVHRGHQALIAEARAQADGAPVVVLTFDPHPARVVDAARAPATLMTLDQKAEALGALGVDHVAVLAFTPARAAASPEAFAREVLRDALGAGVVVVGGNFRFGRERKGDVAALQRLGVDLGFRVATVPPVFHGGAPISSSRIREALGQGEVAGAAALLGRPYAVDGPVVKGDGRGRRIGIPTANVTPVNEILPRGGVYAGGLVERPGGVWRPAALNVGRRPTFGGATVTLEAHVLDFDGDLYGTDVRIEFHDRIRDEQVFPGPEALVARIREDIAEARQRLRYSRTGK